MPNVRYDGEELVATIKNAGGFILAVTEDRNWIEVLFDGDSMHTKTVDLPDRFMFNKVKMAQDLIQRGLLASV